MNDKDLYWLAGLLEGEGSFLKPPPSEMNRPRICLQMTDEDVIQKANQLFGLRYYMRDENEKSERWNPSFRIAFRGKRAAALMRLVYPIMGERRKRQIENALQEQPDNEYYPTPENWFYWLVGLLEGEGAFQKSRPSKQNQPRIQLGMTDQDVVTRATALMQVSLQGPYYRHGTDANFKSRYFAFVYGKHAIELMKQLHPHMSLRRQAQIDAVINSYHPVGHAQGECHPQAKLDSVKVRQIKQRLAEGEKLTTLAQEFSVDKGLIWQIKADRIWQHVK